MKNGGIKSLISVLIEWKRRRKKIPSYIPTAFKFIDVEDGMQTTRIFFRFLKFYELLEVIYFTLFGRG